MVLICTIEPKEIELFSFSSRMSLQKKKTLKIPIIHSIYAVFGLRMKIGDYNYILFHLFFRSFTSLLLFFVLTDK